MPGSGSKTAVVTGATSGIGRAVALRLAGHGWRVVAIGRRAEELERLAAEVGDGPGIDPRPADLTEFPYRDLIPERVDAIVHSAGLMIDTGSVAEATPQDWTYSFTLNVTAGAELVRLALPALRQSQGTVVLINSGAGVTPLPRNTVYGATKHALRALANGLRKDEERYGVRVASVFPGPVDTPLFTADVDRSEMIQPESVAEAVVQAIEASPDVQLTEIQVRPRRELDW